MDDEVLTLSGMALPGPGIVGASSDEERLWVGKGCSGSLELSTDGASREKMRV